MSQPSKVHKFKSLKSLATRLHSDVNDLHCVLIYAYNRTGKTRLSMEFKDQGKRKGKGAPNTLYFNAYTEDLFVWHNDLDQDTNRYLKINEASSFFDGLKDLALDETIAGYLSRYADFEFDIDYENWTVTFRKGLDENIKISRGEERIFIWCLFMAICERVIDGLDSYRWVTHLYIDDPISSLDDNNAIAIACDLAEIVRKAARRRGENDEPAPIRTLFSSHHALFFNVMCNELGRTPEGQEKISTKRYFLHRQDADGAFTMRATGDTPYFHHVATLAELQRCVQTGTLYTYHFNALRSILERTASFLGHDDLRVCLAGLEDEALYNRALHLLSHGKYAITEPVEMVDDNKELFRRILTDVLDRFKFAVPDLAPTPKKANP
ncbi:anticodon nuclease [Roseibium salinum]|uniref:Anticodon nuclease n=1 Tax=Roseibium salinum TaxID=1604349 RepID=A0ABT3R051_9HYPH|nr:anticodon nuclease [Roseibium sp. DSM 29163]MCX2722586.1 anticodon nuclease [Roseibium sp. DSM 29163]